MINYPMSSPLLPPPPRNVFRCVPAVAHGIVDWYALLLLVKVRVWAR